MYLLAIDSATNSGGVALTRNSEIIGLVMLKAPLRYQESLLECVDLLLQKHSLSIRQVDCFAAAAGPGSFTGLRIGLATVKGFCQGLGKPAVGLSTLASLAWRFRHVSQQVAPMMDARRQQVYGALYRVSSEEPEPIRQETVLPPAEWLRRLPNRPGLLVGDGAQMYRQTIAALQPEAQVLSTDNCILSELCQLAYHRFLSGRVVAAGDLKGNYIRPSDVEISAAAQ